MEYFNKELDGETVSREDQEVIHRLFPKPHIETSDNTLIEFKVPEYERTDYELRNILIDGNMYYQIERPYTDLPFTTVTYDFETKGHLPFFSSLFVSNVWGISGNDILFLKHMWGVFNMDGVFDIDKLVRDRVDACTRTCSDSDPEPVVYRRTIEEVLTTKNKRRGFYS
jgi:hypothetical protein